MGVAAVLRRIWPNGAFACRHFARRIAEFAMRVASHGQDRVRRKEIAGREAQAGRTAGLALRDVGERVVGERDEGVGRPFGAGTGGPCPAGIAVQYPSD